MTKMRNGKLGKKMKNRLSVQLGIAILIVDFLVLLLSFVLQYWKVNDILMEHSAENTIQWHEQTEYNMDRFCEQSEFVASKLLLNREVQRLSKAMNLSDADRTYCLNAVLNAFSEMRSDYAGISAITYFGDDGLIVKNIQTKNIVIYDNDRENWYYSSDIYLDENDEIMWISGYTNDDFGVREMPEKNNYFITLCTNTLSKTGKILIHYDMDYFIGIFHASAETTDSNMYIINQNNQIAAANDSNTIGQEKIFTDGEMIEERIYKYIMDGEGGKVQAVVYSLPMMDWKLVTENLVTDVTKDSRYMLEVLLTICILCMIISFAFFSYWISKTLKPLKLLSSKMQKVKDGELGSVVEKIPNNEIGLLMTEFNSMSLELKESFLKIKQTEMEKREFEMQALRAQLNPHLIYNTLNTIKWTAIIDNKMNIAKSITLLAEFLKPIFRGASPICSIKEELDYVNVYIAIMNLRKAEKYSLKIDVPEEFYKYQIIRFMLQPVVENSILHGFEEELSGEICISMQTEGKDAIIKITDNGNGIEKEKLEILQQQLAHSEISTEKGVGINNVNRRLKTYYGDAYGLTIENGMHNGTIVTLRFKLEEV